MQQGMEGEGGSLGALKGHLGHHIDTAIGSRDIGEGPPQGDSGQAPCMGGIGGTVDRRRDQNEMRPWGQGQHLKHKVGVWT